MATTIIVLFNLQDGVHIHEYEAWAKKTDLPVVRSLKSIDSFDVYKLTGMLMGDGTPPYRYCEIIQVNDMETFGAEVSTEVMKKVAGEFRGFADNPLFITAAALA